MPQEITRTQIEKYTVYTGPTAESFSPIMAGITYPDPAYEILVYRRPLCVFEYVLSGRGHIERNGSILTVNAGDAYILTAGTYHHYYSDKVDPWTKIWFNVSGSLVQHLLSDYGLDGVTLIPRFHNETPLTRILDAFTADPVHSADKLAQSMLSRTTLPVSAISTQLGFLDPHHFSSFFKKQCGLSPASYRKLHTAPGNFPT